MTDEAIGRYYSLGLERDRLLESGGSLELVRTLELLAETLPSPPARVLDVGGAAGVYATRLAAAGHDVHLLDPVPLHVEQARDLATARPNAVFAADVGDARELGRFAAGSADVVLLLGPLYHLTERTDRVRAFAEARRVLRSGGVVAAAAISRYASLLDGTRHGHLEDPRFAAIVERDLRDGQHRNPDGVEGWFTTAYFHLPDELRSEAEEAGLAVERVVGIEGPAAWLGLWPDQRELALGSARLAEATPLLSPHMLCLARR